MNAIDSHQRSAFATLIGNASADFVSGVRAWRLWTKFAWHDLLARYRRSWVGPIWLALSAAVYIGALSIVYSTLFRQNIADYVPFVALGVACWSFVSAVASEGVNTFVEAETYIRHTRTSLFIYIFRVLWRNILVFMHQFVVALFVVVLLGKFTLSLLPLAALGLLLLWLQAVWAIPLLSLMGTRFRDLQPIIANLLQVLFFITPVIWFPSALGARRWIADINPLQSLIAVVRDPLLGIVPAATTYAYVGAVTLGGFVLATLCYCFFRVRVVYWL
jgi:lipopolysaccharide transport system permease protein